ncbi:MAG TPA: redoxin domain-containing protein [Planctomycetota bacterium]|nr:redoxin domain-containing protein [Planctomycetota bacterium]
MIRPTISLLAAALLLQDPPKQSPKILDNPSDHGIGRKIEGLLDAHLKERKALVVFFTASDCPVSKLYRPGILRFAKDATGRGAGCLLVYCNPADKPDATDVGFPVVHDRDGKISKSLGARRTTDTFVLDASGVLRYRGAIDDQYGIGYHRDKPTRKYLVDAFEAVLAGKSPEIAATEAPGCPIEEQDRPSDAPLTWHKDIEPVFQAKCMECHRPGMIGPFSLLKYEQVKASVKRVREAVESRRMPPWHANPDIGGPWENNRGLSKDEADRILRWIDSGAAKGDPKDAPAPKVWVDGWTIGKPDIVYEMPDPIEVPAEGAIPYKYVRIRTNFKEDRWIKAAEVRPGAREVVHHILTFVEFPLNRLREQRPIDGGLFHGYFAALVPGERPNVYADGMGKLLPAGAHIIFQIHYNAVGKKMSDRSSIGLVFAEKAPKVEVTTRGIVNRRLKIPPGAANHKEEASFTFPHEAKILSFMPHSHVRGKAWRYTAYYPDGKEEVLLDVPQYDFNWQSSYRYQDPKLVPKGTKVVAVCWFDNSPGNPANPDPKVEVKWGMQTWEEMLIGYMDFIKTDPKAPDGPEPKDGK